MVQEFKVGKLYRLNIEHSGKRRKYPAGSLLLLLATARNTALFDLIFLCGETVVRFQNTNLHCWDEAVEGAG